MQYRKKCQETFVLVITWFHLNITEGYRFFNSLYATIFRDTGYFTNYITVHTAVHLIHPPSVYSSSSASNSSFSLGLTGESEHCVVFHRLMCINSRSGEVNASLKATLPMSRQGEMMQDRISVPFRIFYLFFKVILYYTGACHNAHFRSHA